MSIETPVAPPIAEIIRPSHVAIEVSDLGRSIRFWQSVFGLQIFADDRADPLQPSVKGVVGGFGVELAQSPPSGDGVGRRPAGAFTPMVLSFTVADLDLAFERLKAMKLIEVAAPAEISGVRFFTVHDPDGLPIELIQFPKPITALAELSAYI